MRIRFYFPALMLAACIGQTHAADLNLHATLNGHSVVSATTSQATGEARAVLTDDGKVSLDLIYDRLDANATGASLHSGKSTENGPVLMQLNVSKNETGDSLIDEQFDLDGAAAQQMRDGQTYIVVDTIDHPDGAIRGQLIPQPVSLAGAPEPTTYQQAPLPPAANEVAPAPSVSAPPVPPISPAPIQPAPVPPTPTPPTSAPPAPVQPAPVPPEPA